jgi:hypothetical protein
MFFFAKECIHNHFRNATMTLSIMPLSIMTFSIATHNIMTFIILKIECDTQHYNTLYRVPLC